MGISKGSAKALQQILKSEHGVSVTTSQARKIGKILLKLYAEQK